ncbi:MAG: hypothetical protein U0572_16710 [Phycisphaerales bacterium]
MQPVTAVMLIGGLRRSALERAVGCPPTCLPLDANVTLFDAWTSLIARSGGHELRVVTAAGATAADIARAIEVARVADDGLTISHAIEESAHRGTGGLLRDVTADLPDDHTILLVEPNCVPPPSLLDLIDAGRGCDMAVGVAQADAPAGAYLLRRKLLDLVPPIGYHDLKEQLVPASIRHGATVLAVRLQSSGIRVHDLNRYQVAVATWAKRGGSRVHSAAKVDPTARILGMSIVGPGAAIGARTIIDNSVVMAGAAVGEGAVLARSVVPRGLRVAPRSLVTDRVLDRESSDAADELLALGVGSGGSR